jgi:hypothetical protein
MTVYKTKKSHSLKWLFAIIIFVLAMTITWSDLYGAEVAVETSSVMQAHQTSVASVAAGRSRFHPNWFPGFPKPARTILATVSTPQIATTDAAVAPTNLTEQPVTNVLEIHRRSFIDIS